MILKEEDIQFIVDSFSIKPEYIAIGGSFVLPIITKKRDVDYIIGFNVTSEEMYIIREEAKLIRQALIKRGYKEEEVCLISKNTEMWRHQKPLSSELDTPYLIPNICFEHYHQFIYGSRSNELDLLGKDKDLYIESLKRHYNYLKETKGHVLLLKYWYYVYLGCCIILNNSFDNFTEEQINDINIIHDANNPVLYNEALNRLDILINEI